MDVIVARKVGFCFGVKRAMEISEKAAIEGKDKPVHTHGPVVHNPDAVARLEDLGVKAIKDLSGKVKGTIIIRAHGVPPEVYEEARKKNLQLLDATCPFVKRAQDHAKMLAEKGYQIVIIGEKDHPEVKGVKGHAGEKAIVVETLDEARQVPFSAKLGVVVQTTQEMEFVNKAIAILFDKTKELRAFNTVCSATRERQEAVRELVKDVDAVIVIGGKNSGNTQRLHQIAVEKVPSYHVERASEIKPEWLKGVKRIGVTAGASTPDFVIMDVISHLKGESTYETAIALFVKNGKVLMEERDVTRKIYPNTWFFPGGFLKEGEKAQDAIIRRMNEELGVKVTKLSPVLVVEDANITPGKKFNQNFFVVKWDGEPAAKQKQTLEWVELGKITGKKLPDVFKAKAGEILEAIEANC